jgi:hypothetical protein
MLPGKNPLREKDLSDYEGPGQTWTLETSRRDVIVGGAAVVAAFGLPMRSLAYQTIPASASAQHANNQGETRMNMITTKNGISKIGARDGPSCSRMVGRSVRMRGTHRCCF